MSNLDKLISETSSNYDTLSIISYEEEDIEEEEEEDNDEDNNEEADNDEDNEEGNDNIEADNDNEGEASTRPTTSDVWNFVDKKTRKCPSCGKIFNKKTGTSSIRTHL